jgi:hypothetical protein
VLGQAVFADEAVRAANFVLQPRVTDLSLDSTTVTGTIFGDEFMAGDDVLFGGLCARTPCRWFGFGGGFSGPDRQVEVRRRWNDPSHQLALYKSHQNPDAIAIAFEQNRVTIGRGSSPRSLVIHKPPRSPQTSWAPMGGPGRLTDFGRPGSKRGRQHLHRPRELGGHDGSPLHLYQDRATTPTHRTP